MIIVSAKVRREYSGWRCCEWCRHYKFCHCAHVQAKGRGQLDIHENCLSLCYECHIEGQHWKGDPSEADIRQVVAAREGTTAEVVQALVWALNRAPKGSSYEEVKRAVAHDTGQAAGALLPDPLISGAFGGPDRMATPKTRHR